MTVIFWVNVLMFSHPRHGTGDMSNLSRGGCAWWLAWWVSSHWRQIYLNGHGTQECAGGFRPHWYPWKQDIDVFNVILILLCFLCIICPDFKFDHSGRTFPCNLPAWMVVLETTLGCKQGTLWKAPRNADREVKDTNSFCRNDFWNFVACKASKPLSPSTWACLACFFLCPRFLIFMCNHCWGVCVWSAKVCMWPLKAEPFSAMKVEGHWPKLVGNMFFFIFFCCQKKWRTQTFSVLYQPATKDKEETSQWLASPATLKSILEASLSRVSSLKGQVLLIHHLTPYEGTFEKAQMTKMNSLSTNKFINPEVALDFMLELQDMCHIACYSQCDNPTIFQYALMQVKDKLLEDCFLLHSWMFFVLDRTSRKNRYTYTHTSMHTYIHA